MELFRRTAAMDKPLSVKVTEQEFQAVKDEAKRRRVNQSEVIRDAMALYFMVRDAMPNESDLYAVVQAKLGRKAGVK